VTFHSSFKLLDLLAAPSTERCSSCAWKVIQTPQILVLTVQVFKTGIYRKINFNWTHRKVYIETRLTLDTQ